MDRTHPLAISIKELNEYIQDSENEGITLEYKLRHSNNVDWMKQLETWSKVQPTKRYILLKHVGCAEPQHHSSPHYLNETLIPLKSLVLAISSEPPTFPHITLLPETLPFPSHHRPCKPKTMLPFGKHDQKQRTLHMGLWSAMALLQVQAKGSEGEGEGE